MSTAMMKMIRRLVTLWELDDGEANELLSIVESNEQLQMELLQIHASLRILFPQHPLIYQWVSLRNTELNGSRALDLMLHTDGGIKRIALMLKKKAMR
ncbi:hypothetical protein [Vibrio natriegens]|uniref:hypothetical protein n=1 Tax=Vibrio natriegens TaxID=691 RepID=UPI001FBAF3EC|nr:hypothetical protein [Vibrio natriegens]